jgi:hypothetical protein
LAQEIFKAPFCRKTLLNCGHLLADQLFRDRSLETPHRLPGGFLDHLSLALVDVRQGGQGIYVGSRQLGRSRIPGQQSKHPFRSRPSGQNSQFRKHTGQTVLQLIDQARGQADLGLQLAGRFTQRMDRWKLEWGRLLDHCLTCVAHAVGSIALALGK